MSQLIVNADDFGLHSAVNGGIIKGHQKGIITSTSLLAGGDAFEEAVHLAHDNPKLGIGIHIALVGGLKPLSDPAEIPSLVTDEGLFVSDYVEFMKRVYTNKINYEEVRKEIKKQVDAVFGTGLSVTHIDGHQHMHILPSVLPIVLEQALANNIKVIRVPNEEPLFLNGNYNPLRLFGKTGLSVMAERSLQAIRNSGLYFPQYFWGMINGGHLSERTLFGILKEVKARSGVHELMTHPGSNDGVLQAKYNWNYHWENELKALCSDHVRLFIMQHHIELIHYGDLL